MCLNCYHFRVDERRSLELSARLKLVSAGRLVEAKELTIPGSADSDGVKALDEKELRKYLRTFPRVNPFSCG
jgi:hypothetical protein